MLGQKSADSKRGPIGFYPMFRVCAPKIGILACILILSACGTIGSRLSCIESVKIDQAGSNENSLSDIVVNVGIDGSGSMLGFVNRQGTRYGQAIDSLNTLIAAKGLSKQAVYWRLGNGKDVNGPQKLNSSKLLQARNAEFYCKGVKDVFPCVTSTLSQLIDVPISPPKERLDILLTDLEPDSGSVGSLTQKYSQLLKERPNYKVMILGVRSEYEGPIYPAQIGAFKPFNYSTTGKNVDQFGRPFYVLISGPPRSVDEFAAAFRDLPMQVSQAFRAVSFSKDGISNDIVMLDKQSTWGNTVTSECLSEINAFNRTVPTRPSEWLLATVKSDCNNKPFKIKVTSTQQSTLIGANVDQSAFKINGTSGLVQINQTTSIDGHLNLLLQINPKVLTTQLSNEPIRLDLDRKALNKALWKGWDTSVSNPAGPKTQNLMLFISSMETVFGHTSQNDLAVRFCIGLESVEDFSRTSTKPPVLVLALPLLLILVFGTTMTILRRSQGED